MLHGDNNCNNTSLFTAEVAAEKLFLLIISGVISRVWLLIRLVYFEGCPGGVLGCWSDTAAALMRRRTGKKTEENRRKRDAEPEKVPETLWRKVA